MVTQLMGMGFEHDQVSTEQNGRPVSRNFPVLLPEILWLRFDTDIGIA